MRCKVENGTVIIFQDGMLMYCDRLLFIRSGNQEIYLLLDYSHRRDKKAGYIDVVCIPAIDSGWLLLLCFFLLLYCCVFWLARDAPICFDFSCFFFSSPVFRLEVLEFSFFFVFHFD